MRKQVIALAAVAALIAGSISEVSARGGGGGHGGGGGGGHGGGGGGGHGGFGGGHGGFGGGHGFGGVGGGFGGHGFGGMRGGFGGMHAGFARAGGIGHAGFARPAFAHGGFGRVGVARPAFFHGNRFAFRHPGSFRNHRRFGRNRFAFIGAGAGYDFYDSYYDSCYARVWTPYGWQWTDVCYY